jgi:hypothetical protein
VPEYLFARLRRCPTRLELLVSAYLATIIKYKHELRARRLYQIIFTRNVSDDFNVSRKTDNQFVLPLETNDTCFDAKALGRTGNSFAIGPGENMAAF